MRAADLLLAPPSGDGRVPDLNLDVREADVWEQLQAGRPPIAVPLPARKLKADPAQSDGPNSVRENRTLRDLTGTRPLVGVPIGHAGPQAPGVLRLRRVYCRAIWLFGGFPVLLPPAPEAAITSYFDELDALLFTGGDDVSPELYKESAGPTTSTDAPRDRLELQLLEHALRRRVPVLGICRGHQLINVALGGSLIQDLPSSGWPPHRQLGRRDACHHVLQLQTDARLTRLLGQQDFPVNSLHHQGVARVAPDLQAVGWSPDHLVEALEAPSSLHPWLFSVQYHPEELVPNHRPSRALLEAFIRAASARCSERHS